MRTWPYRWLVGLTVAGALTLLWRGSTGTTVSAADPRLSSVHGQLLLGHEPFTGVVETATDGQVERTPYANGRRDGIAEGRYRTGQLASVRRYRAGIKVGRHLGYWPDGSLQYDRPFDEQGRYHGIVRSYYFGGQMHEVKNYLDGQEVGAQRSWSETGEVRANYVVRDGRRYGLSGSQPCFTVGAGHES